MKCEICERQSLLAQAMALIENVEPLNSALYDDKIADAINAIDDARHAMAHEHEPLTNQEFIAVKIREAFAELSQAIAIGQGESDGTGFVMEAFMGEMFLLAQWSEYCDYKIVHESGHCAYCGESLSSESAAIEHAGMCPVISAEMQRYV